MKRDIALALSGGGFRATCFHLGVLKKLRDLELLDRVGLISSVSGGSILAGLYMTSLVRGESFDQFEANAREFVNRRWPLDWPALVHDFLPWSKSSSSLERAYSRVFRHRDGRLITMRDLTNVAPYLVVNSTAVHSGAGWCFLSGGTARHWDLGFTHSNAFKSRFRQYECDVSLATAVAASSAFPTFTAVTIAKSLLRKTEDESKDDPEVEAVVAPLNPEIPDPLVLSDGGVLDNLGITAIISGICPPASPGTFYLVGSDAGAMTKQLHRPPAGRFRKLRYVMRQLSIQGGHNDDMTQFLALLYYRTFKPMGVAMFRIQRAVPHAGENLEQVRELATIDTRLKRIPPVLLEGLMRHAGNLLWTRLTEYTDLLPAEKAMPRTEKRRRLDIAEADVTTAAAGIRQQSRDASDMR